MGRSALRYPLAFMLICLVNPAICFTICQTSIKECPMVVAQRTNADHTHGTRGASFQITKVFVPASDMPQQ
jgi:hypothetical protein